MYVLFLQTKMILAIAKKTIRLELPTMSNEKHELAFTSEKWIISIKENEKQAQLSSFYRNECG